MLRGDTNDCGEWICEEQGERAVITVYCLKYPSPSSCVSGKSIKAFAAYFICICLRAAFVLYEAAF